MPFNIFSLQRKFKAYNLITWEDRKFGLMEKLGLVQMSHSIEDFSILSESFKIEYAFIASFNLLYFVTSNYVA